VLDDEVPRRCARTHFGDHDDGRIRLDPFADVTEVGETCSDRLDEYFDGSAAGQTDSDSVVVGDAEDLDAAGAVGENLLGDLVQRTLDAPARDTAYHLTGARDSHGRTRHPR
jgi:hypothetical protein